MNIWAKLCITIDVMLLLRKCLLLYNTFVFNNDILICYLTLVIYTCCHFPSPRSKKQKLILFKVIWRLHVRFKWSHHYFKGEYGHRQCQTISIVKYEIVSNLTRAFAKYTILKCDYEEGCLRRYVGGHVQGLHIFSTPSIFLSLPYSLSLPPLSRSLFLYDISVCKQGTC